MNRRGFIKSLLAIAATAAVAPETLIADSASPAVDVIGIVGDTFRKGDVITIGGVFNVHPATGKVLPHLKYFMVMEDAITTDGHQSLKLFPAMLGHNSPYRTVSELPALNAEIKLQNEAMARALRHPS